jgi:hypothetical protein
MIEFENLFFCAEASRAVEEARSGRSRHLPDPGTRDPDLASARALFVRSRTASLSVQVPAPRRRDRPRGRRKKVRGRRRQHPHCHSRTVGRLAGQEERRVELIRPCSRIGELGTAGVFSQN